ncbi:putative disease resistance protein RGA3 [Cornus florida]|uniref:putative disease resistance protein RGA3 n=1 Tax=Cornus florida TaxID=4283 RepID=UPI00289FB2CF|nr:putative disease resistance protein RGA3 [Cornus florida]
MWVCVSDVFDLKQIAENIVESATGRKPESLRMEGVQNELRREIGGKKYLLVLDDVWNEDREQWIGLRDLLMSGAQGSKILITNRTEFVATITGTNWLYTLKGLSDQESWSLFKQMAFKEGKEPKIHV